MDKADGKRRFYDGSFLTALINRRRAITIASDRKKQKSAPVFGVDLIEYLHRSGDDVPIILKRCVEVIEMHGVVSGVYRQCGIQSNVQKLRNGFDTGNIPNFQDETILNDIHSVSSLLKQYFRQLPNPLFTFQLYREFMVAYETNNEMRMEKFKCLIDRLPHEHYRTAKYLVRHLTKLCQCTHLTDMNSRNLAIVWAPNLFRYPACAKTWNDSILLQGLNIQTAVFNYILLHATFLFSINSCQLLMTSISLSEGAIARHDSIEGRHVEDSESSSHSSREIEGHPDSLCLSPITTSSTSLIQTSARQSGTAKQPKQNAEMDKWKRILRGPSVDNAFVSLRKRWKKHSSDGSSVESVKWRTQPIAPSGDEHGGTTPTCSSSSSSRSKLRAARSASLITFVTKSVEEFRDGVLRSWRQCAHSNTENMTNGGGGGSRSGPAQSSSTASNLRTPATSTPRATTIATDIVKRRNFSSFIASEQHQHQKASSFDANKTATLNGENVTELGGGKVGDARASGAAAWRRNECSDEEVSISSNDSYRHYLSNRSKQEANDRLRMEMRPVDDECKHQNGTVSCHDEAVSSSSIDDTKLLHDRDDDELLHAYSSATNSSRSSSTCSLHNDRSRYDNVSPHPDDGTHYMERPLSFYDLPQNYIKTVKSNVQLYFL